MRTKIIISRLEGDGAHQPQSTSRQLMSRSKEGCMLAVLMPEYKGGYCKESSRNTREGDSNNNPRGQYPIPSRRRGIDHSK